MSTGRGGAAKPVATTTEIRVRYAETDAMGVVYYANYFVWFELGRTDWIRARGPTYRAMEEAGILLPVVEAHCVYRASARYDDLVRLETVAAALTPARVSFAYTLRAVRAAREGAPGGETLLAEGRTDHVFLTREGRIARLTRHPRLWEALAAAYAASAGAGTAGGATASGEG